MSEVVRFWLDGTFHGSRTVISQYGHVERERRASKAFTRFPAPTIVPKPFCKREGAMTGQETGVDHLRVQGQAMGSIEDVYQRVFMGSSDLVRSNLPFLNERGCRRRRSEKEL
jgi:hypothetical protein